MHKFTPLIKNNSPRIIITKYNWPIEQYLRGHAVIIHLNSLNDIDCIQNNLDGSIKVDGYVYTNEFASLETLDLKPDWKDLPIILQINRLGKYRNIHEKIELLRSMNVIIFFTGNENRSTADAQIAASLGIHSGIILRDNATLDDPVLDLITYNFYSLMPHADIEPFSTMERYYDGENIVSPAIAYFNNPCRYIYLDSEHNYSLSENDFNKGKCIDAGLDKLLTIGENHAVEESINSWQQLFIDSHPCSYCPAFRICSGYFKVQFEKGRCKHVMKELLEAIEFQKKKKNQFNRIRQCQL